jgi:ATP-dependent protease ClpP protease subunit/phage major head subunit gpT-like protein
MRHLFGRIFASPKPRLRNADPWYEITAAAGDDVAEISIFGPIGGGFFAEPDAPSGKRVAQQLDELDDSVKTIKVRINSPGGSVYDAIHIANALKRQRDEFGRNVEVEIEALAASAATIVSSAGDTIRMPKNALMMVHNPHAIVLGGSSTMREMADVLDKVRENIVATYRWVSRLAPNKIRGLMDKTTWMNATEALSNGFITEVAKPVRAAAHFDPGAIAQLGDIPEQYRDQVLALFDDADRDADDQGADPPDDNDDEPEGDDTEHTPPDDDDAGGDLDPEGDQGNDDDVGDDDAPNAEPSEEEMNFEQLINAIVKIALDGGLPDKDVKAQAATAKLADTEEALEAFRNWCAEKLAALPSNTAGPGQIPAGQSVVPGEDEHDKRARGIEAALFARAASARRTVEAAAEKFPDDPRFKIESDGGGEFRAMSLYELAKADLDRMVPGRSSKVSDRMKIVGEFFNTAGNYQTTSDFAVAGENTLNKVLLAAYAIAPDTWREICAIGEVSDFRAHNRYRTGYIASLDQIFEDGEFTNKTIPDAVKETITALTYGNIVGLSRQAIINDDMGVFNRVAAQVGRAAALTIEAGFYSLLAQNSGLGPDMNDGNPLFDAAHSNLGAGAALSAAAVDADATIMEAQQDPNSAEYLNVRPAVLLVPRGLRATALTINESRFDPDTADSNKPNTVLGLFDRVVATPRLSGTRRYMFADPVDIPCIEVAFLNGEQEPFMEMKDGWRTDGVEWKVRHDFGIAAIEYRAGLTDAGA